MYTIIGCAIIGILFLGRAFGLQKSSYLGGRGSNFDNDFGFKLFMICLWGGSIGLGVGFLIALFVGISSPQVWEEEGTWNLASLRSSDGISGSFFLGSGTIGSSLYYFAYIDYGSGGLQPYKVLANDQIRIFEEKDRKTGQMKVWHTTLANPFLKGFVITMRSQKWEFFIPEGSLVRNFRL